MTCVNLLLVLCSKYPRGKFSIEIHFPIPEKLHDGKIATKAEDELEQDQTDPQWTLAVSRDDSRPLRDCVFRRTGMSKRVLNDKNGDALAECE
jgi:hypothetical protein